MQRCNKKIKDLLNINHDICISNSTKKYNLDYELTNIDIDFLHLLSFETPIYIFINI